MYKHPKNKIFNCNFSNKFVHFEIAMFWNCQIKKSTTSLWCQCLPFSLSVHFLLMGDWAWWPDGCYYFCLPCLLLGAAAPSALPLPCLAPVLHACAAAPRHARKVSAATRRGRRRRRRESVAVRRRMRWRRSGGSRGRRRRVSRGWGGAAARESDREGAKRSVQSREVGGGRWERSQSLRFHRDNLDRWVMNERMSESICWTIG